MNEAGKLMIKYESSWARKFQLLMNYNQTMWYLLKTQGPSALYNFIFGKLFIRETGIAIFDPIFRKFPSLAPYPFNIEIEVTTKCNLKCIHCEHTHWKEPARDLTFDQFKKFIDQFPNLKWCNPTGEGSAFMNPDYLKMLKYLKDKHVYVEFVDTFLDIKEEQARELIKMAVDRIWISIDGATKKTYETIKCGSNFEKVLENIKKFAEIKKEMKSPLPELVFRYVITELNKKEMPQFIELIHKLGGKEKLGAGCFIEFAGLLEFNENKKFNTQLSPEIIKKTMQTAKELNIHATFTNQSKKRPVEKCAMWTEPYVMMGGDVVCCCGILMSNKRDFLRLHSFGNIHKTSFKEIWNSKKYKAFRKMINDPTKPIPAICKNCRSFDTMHREKSLKKCS